MKRIVFITFAVGLLSLATACGSTGQQSSKKGNFAQGAQLWANTCQRCHNLRDAQDMSDDDWFATSLHMRVRAGLTGQDMRDILAFLQSANTDRSVR